MNKIPINIAIFEFESKSRTVVKCKAISHDTKDNAVQLAYEMLIDQGERGEKVKRIYSEWQPSAEMLSFIKEKCPNAHVTWSLKERDKAKFAKKMQKCFKWIILFIVIAVIGYWLLPELPKGEDARKIMCANNLKQIGFSIRIYADRYDGQYPPFNGAKGLDLLRSTGLLSNPQIFICPYCNTIPAELGTPLTEATVDYEYIGGKNKKFPADSIIACDKPHNHDRYGTILFVDGHVKGYAGVNWLENAGNIGDRD